jgi:general secretion pathway protein B
MSVILDALKKLDREKSARRTGMPNIAAEILRPDLPRPGKRILLYLAAVSIATAVITYAVVMEFGFLSRSSPPAVQSPPEPTKQISSAPSETGSVPKSSPIVTASPTATVTPPQQTKRAESTLSESGSLVKSLPPEELTPPAATQSPEPIRDARDEIRRVPPKIQSDAENKTPASSPGKKEAIPNLLSREAVVIPQTRKVPEPPTTPPPLRISGIVWSEEPLKRIAVINGAVFTEGSVIEGMTILEIYPTRVRFSQNDLAFEIPLGSTIPIK